MVQKLIELAYYQRMDSLNGPIANGFSKQIYSVELVPILAKTTLGEFSGILVSVQMMEMNFVGRGSFEKIERNQLNLNNFSCILVTFLLILDVIIFVNPVSQIFIDFSGSSILKKEGRIFYSIFFTSLVLLPISIIFSMINYEQTTLSFGSSLLLKLYDPVILPWQRTYSPI